MKILKVHTIKQWNCVKNLYLMNTTLSQTLWYVHVSDGQHFCFSGQSAGMQYGWEGAGGESYHCLHCQTCHYRVLWLSTISTLCNMVLFGKGPLRRHRPFGVKMDYNTSRTPSNMEQYNERCYVLLYLDWHLFTQCQSLLPLLSRCVLQTWRLRYLLQENKQSNRTLSSDH